MFGKGEYIIYASTGVCKIEDIRKERFGGASREYYILKPEYVNNSKIYAPVGSSENRMKKIISKEDVQKLIHSMPTEEMIWIEDDNARKEKFNELVKGGDRRDLVKLLKTLHCKQKEKLAAGKKFHSADERVMKEAEKILFEEFALVLEISPDEVVGVIQDEFEAQHIEAIS